MKVVIFVSFPGMGKTTIAKQLDCILIEQDDYYDKGKADHTAYLNAIEYHTRNSKNTKNIILCKNHHTKKSLNEVTDILRRNTVEYIIFNLVPENLDEIQDIMLENLLNRIEEGKRTDSHLCISENVESRKHAKCVIRYGFIKKYEEPEEPFIRLNYLSPVSENVTIINSFLN